MKAVVQTRYGQPEDLVVQDVSEPTPAPGEVRIRVVAASINDWDWALSRGKPFYIRLLCGLRRPRVRIPGVDVAGVVDAVGTAAQRWKVGDRVFGDLSETGFGSFAERVCAPEEALGEAPSLLTLQEAAALPHAAALALQGLRDVGQLQPGERVLINGAGGGVGTLGVQMARQLGASEVVGVDHRDKQEVLLACGFTRVLDYRTCDFTREQERYDLVLDVRSDRPAGAYARALEQGGRYVTVGGHADKLLRVALRGKWMAPKGKRLRVLALKPNRDLDQIQTWCEAGLLRPVVDRVFSLAEVPTALRRFGDGLHTGKILVDVGEE